jgi:nucleotide-binding universal stress UspA family protein
MKNIIVAVDFSDCSINALEHAITIAQKGDLKMNLVWVNNPTTTKILLSSDQSSEMVAEVKNQFGKLITKYQKLLPPDRIEYSLREGKVFREIAALAKEKDAILIVAGTHGTSGFEEFWIGSNASKIVTYSPCPVITIRGGVKVNRELTKIVMPIDSTPESRQKASFTADLAGIFDAEIHLVSLYTTGIESIQCIVDSYTKQVKKFLEGANIKVVLASMRVDNIALATIDYAEKVDANLISIMTEQETATSNLWLGPYATQTVNHSSIPVLSIHPKDFNIVLGL